MFCYPKNTRSAVKKKKKKKNYSKYTVCLKIDETH